MSAVLTAAPAARFTPDDLSKLPDEGQGFELVDGELKELNVSFLSTFVAGKGRVLHVMGHAWQEKSDLEGTVSMQRLALNFVRERIERDAK